MTTPIARLADRATDYGLALDAAQRNAFAVYLQTIIEANRVQNLTSLRTEEEIVDGLFLDSLAAAPTLRQIEGPIVDAGTGAGIPGIPLAIVLPAHRFTLVDANGKKTRFVRRIAGSLHFDNVDVCQARAEELGRNPSFREHFGVAMAKGLAELRVLIEWLVPLVRPRGRVLCWKGPALPKELGEARQALEELGAEVEEVVDVPVPGTVRRSLVVIQRVGLLSERYPRRTGKALKHPL